jgi:16S rRNA (uracil1498-N3)-methyltransferase
MHRFYVPAQGISSDKIIISDKNQIHHIKDVLRLKQGDSFAAFDEKGNEYIADIGTLSSRAIELRIKQGQRAVRKGGGLKLTLACAVPKKAKIEDIIDKLTQLGVERVIPLKTERVIVKLDRLKTTGRQQRWERIALSASQQCQRNTLPAVDRVKDIREVLSESRDFDLKLIPVLSGERKTLKEIFAGCQPKNVLVLIGPEGDFTQQEVNSAVRAGFIPVTLGDLVLRVDTAAVAVASFIKLYAQS